MDFGYIKEAVFIGVFLAFMIGPVFFMLIQTSILKGFRAAFAFDLGVILGDVVFLLIAFFGSRIFIERIKDNPYLFMGGGVVMIIYGLVTFLKKREKPVIQDEKLVVKVPSNYLQLFINGFLLNFLNIGVLGFWLGMIVVYSARFGMNEHKIFVFFSLVVLSYLATDVGKILLAKRLRSKMTPSRTYKMKRIMGIILMLFGLVLFAKAFIPKEKLHIKSIEKRIEKIEHDTE